MELMGIPGFPPSNIIETVILTSKGWEEGEDDAVVGSKREGVSERGGEFAPADSSKQKEVPAIVDSHATTDGTAEISGEGPLFVGGDGEGRASLIGLGARGRLRHPVRRRGRMRRHTI